jgi:membrane protease YdiL (CAAX protease family)
VAPLVEELLYRVTILGGMMQQGWLVPGWIVSSLLFGFAHGFPDSIALLPLAFAIGYVYLRRRSYRTVMLVHLLFNGFNMVIAAASMI